MSDPVDSEGKVDEESEMWALFGSIQRTLDCEPSQRGCEDALRQLRSATLLRFRIPSSQPPTTWGRVRAQVMRLSGRSAGKEACIALLHQTGRFSAKELELIRRADALVEESNGTIHLRSGLNLALATVAIASLALLAGVWVGWVLFSDQSGLQLVVNSYVVGSVLGFIAGRVIDKSFRFESLREKIQAVVPCLVR